MRKNRVLPVLAGLGLVMVTVTSVRAETWAERCAVEWVRGESASCEKAIAENARDLRSRHNLAGAFIVRGDNRRLLKAYEEITLVTPNDPMAHFNYGSTAGTLRYYQIAITALHRAIGLKPDFVEAHLVLSMAFDKLGQHAEAAEAKLKAAEFGEITAMYEVAEYYARSTGTPGNERKAFAWMERAANGGHIGAMERMAEIYFHGQLRQTRDPRRGELWRQKAQDARQ